MVQCKVESLQFSDADRRCVDMHRGLWQLPFLCRNAYAKSSPNLRLTFTITNRVARTYAKAKPSRSLRSGIRLDNRSSGGNSSGKKDGGSKDDSKDTLLVFLRKHWAKVLVAGVVWSAIQNAVIFPLTGGREESPFAAETWPLFRNILRVFPGEADEPLQPYSFHKFILVDSQQTSENGKMLTFQTNKPSQWHGSPDPYAEFWAKGIWSVEIKQPQLQVSRKYTPLPPLISSTKPHWEALKGGLLPPWEEDTQRNLRFFVRRERSGEVSNYLHDIPLNKRVEMRGGYSEFELPDDVEEILFLAGGTGIAPAIQVAYTLKLRSAQGLAAPARMHICWANRKRDDCDGIEALASKNSSAQGVNQSTKSILVQQLEKLRDDSLGFQLSVDCFVDSEGTFIREGDLANTLSISESPPEPNKSVGKKLILISGPDGFVEYIAGPKSYLSGQEFKGLSGGALSKIDLRGWHVHKL